MRSLNNTVGINRFIIISMIVHGLFFAGLVYSNSKQTMTIASDGAPSINAVMIDLSLFAAPEQSLVENSTYQEEVVEKVELTISESQVGLLAASKPEEKQQQSQPKPLPKQPKPKQQKNKQNPSLQQVRQEVRADSLANTVVAASSSQNTIYSTIPALIMQTKPEYPRRAVDLRINGYVIAYYDINASGKVENIRITEAKPNNIFNQVVLTAMKKWKYQPIVAKNLSIKIVFEHNRAIKLEQETSGGAEPLVAR